MGILFTPVNPIQALYWSAVINGVVAVPVMTGDESGNFTEKCGRAPLHRTSRP
ncbi:hypothetical protein SAMCFNEI73_Ch0733 [Sinorhizobium americanum]|uniref:Uncharacterized protein n=1 Tax=Sinorhizobium americanum TaxID=194963 RepID=A0A1L3LIZ5_9HYPH|nr:hypothetical protein SAMCCGM7_Ch0737 [Sinorhizobium americanum CCGM7]APG90057.1 hypothetical protein SAMCFNEI73_Ch0733 [Sinorhizobium americanum]